MKRINVKRFLRLLLIALCCVAVFAAIVAGVFYHDVHFYSKYSKNLSEASYCASRGEFEKALKLVDKSIKMIPEDTDNYFFKANIYIALGDNDAAIAEANKGVELSAGPVSKCINLCNRGQLYLDMDQYKLAFDDYNRAVELMPDFPDNYIARASAYTMSGNYKASVDDYTMVISINPQYSMGYWNRACSYCKLGEFELADNDFNSAAKFAGTSFEMAGIHTDWAISKYREGDIEQAKAELNKAFEYDQRFVACMANYLLKMPPIDEIKTAISPAIQFLVEPADIPILCVIVSDCAGDLGILSEEDCETLAEKAGI